MALQKETFMKNIDRLKRMARSITLGSRHVKTERYQKMGSAIFPVAWFLKRVDRRTDSILFYDVCQEVHHLLSFNLLS